MNWLVISLCSAWHNYVTLPFIIKNLFVSRTGKLTCTYAEEMWAIGLHCCAISFLSSKLFELRTLLVLFGCIILFDSQFLVTYRSPENIWLYRNVRKFELKRPLHQEKSLYFGRVFLHMIPEFGNLVAKHMMGELQKYTNQQTKYFLSEYLKSKNKIQLLFYIWSSGELP